MLEWNKTKFLLSVHKLSQLPEPNMPEIAFSGRSNVGKSSLLNRLIGRKSYVKVSGKPGKTQGLNFFLADEKLYLVDLPGYGFARVSKNMQEGWKRLITTYLQKRDNLRCVVIIMDLRHSPKEQDGQLLDWLRRSNLKIVPVYTKVDKLSGNQRNINAKMLDAGHRINREDRVIFSAKSGYGLEELKAKIQKYL